MDALLLASCTVAALWGIDVQQQRAGKLCSAMGVSVWVDQGPEQRAEITSQDSSVQVQLMALPEVWWAEVRLVA